MVDLLVPSMYAERSGGLQGEVYLILSPLQTTDEPDLIAEATLLHGEVDSPGPGAILDADGDGVLDFGFQGSWPLSPGYTMTFYVVAGPIEGRVDIAAAAFAEVRSAEASGYAEATSAGDLDGDGFHDLLLGQPRYGASNGALVVLLGPIPSWADPESADTLLWGHSAYDFVGNSISAGRDVDGDGYLDLAVGGAYGAVSGSAYLVSGPPTVSGDLLDVAIAAIQPDMPGPEDLGSGLSIEQDLDGDGLADLAVGAPGVEANPDPGDWGAVFLFYGPVSGVIGASEADAILLGAPSPDDGQGYVVFSPGDISGDGWEDLYVGSNRTTDGYLVLGGRW